MGGRSKSTDGWLPPVMPTPSVVQISVPDAALLIQLTTNICVQASSTHMGHLDEIPHAWLQPGSALAITSI